ncbi:MAG: hypothetical protein ACK4UY_02250 [Dietzia sp.]
MSEHDAPVRVVASPLAGLGPLDVHALCTLRVDVLVAERDGPYAEIDEVEGSVEGSYEQFGFLRCGPDYLDDRIPHLPMRRDLLG